MPRNTRGVPAKARHKKILARAKGYRGRGKNVFKVAAPRVSKALQYAYRDRRCKKRTFRALWIQRINAAARSHGLTYGRFMYALRKGNHLLDRKILADLAVRSPDAFKALVTKASAILS